METLVVVDQHRNHRYYSRSRVRGGPVSLGSFGSAPSNGFTDINCRTFESGVGILPTPFKACSTSVTKRSCSYSSSPKTPSPSVNSHHSEESGHFKKIAKSGSIPISFNKEGCCDEFPYCELWAGPAYSNSPPPSSLPIPKFLLRPKRTVSLNLPSSSVSDINFHPIAKSAPPSPTRDRCNSFSRDLFHSADSAATKTLRRILNLDIAAE